MAVLDTAAIIDLSRRASSPLRERAWAALRERLDEGDLLATTRFNAAELLAGIHLARDPLAEATKVEFALRWLTILEFDDRSAQTYGKLYARLRRDGRLVADMDLLIASVAIANGDSVVTRNVRHFTGIPGLIVNSY
jgi:predicted nucleic acid-binding protein